MNNRKTTRSLAGTSAGLAVALIVASGGFCGACQPKALTENTVSSSAVGDSAGADAFVQPDSSVDVTVDMAASDSGQADGADSDVSSVCAVPTPCHKYATCVQHPVQGPQCTCGPGFSGDGKVCTGCPPGYSEVKIDVAGVETSVCAANAPVWGARLDAPVSFQMTGLGTVRDTQTRLEWQQAQGAMMTWSEAVVSCDTLSVAGHEDWRLPTIVELGSIFDRTKAQPAVNTNVFGETPQQQWVWTSTKFADNSNSAWAAHNLIGLLDYSLIDLKRAVRCVRSDGEPLVRKLPRFEFAQDGKTVKDLWTSREWRAATSATKETLGGATSLCYELQLGGTGWRLPTVNELLSLVVYDHAFPAADITLFADTPNLPLWTSVKVPTSTDGYFTVVFTNGTLQTGAASIPLHFRCVR